MFDILFKKNSQIRLKAENAQKQGLIQKEKYNIVFYNQKTKHMFKLREYPVFVD